MCIYYYYFFKNLVRVGGHGPLSPLLVPSLSLGVNMYDYMLVVSIPKEWQTVYKYHIHVNAYFHSTNLEIELRVLKVESCLKLN